VSRLFSRLEVMLGPAREGPKEKLPLRGLPPGRWLDEGVFLLEETISLGLGEAPLLTEWGDRSGALCFDLETTGLAGGTGTYAFLAGVGRLDGDSLAVSQLFLTTPAAEKSWLEALDGTLPPRSPLVTYNGKRFDVPLVETRRILHRKEPLDPEGHLDLLHLARALWRDRLPSCRLSEVERSVLGLRRSGDDVPGSLVPELYRQFLADGDASVLAGVFYHNRMDLVALALLRSRLARVLSGETEDGEELVAAGEAWRRRGRRDEALRLWQKARSAGARGSLECLAWAAKAERRWVDAVTLWEEAYGTSADPFSIAVELSKAWEHRLDDLPRAQAWAEKARDLLLRQRPFTAPSLWRSRKGAIDCRLKRLEGKARTKTDSKTV
jgi:tetratricopeptide (TPR) repeat protein